MKKSDIFWMLDEARYYHNIACKESKAIKICNEILDSFPEEIDALLIKAGSLQSLNREKEAFHLINKIIEKWPNHWEAYYLMGLLLFNTNEDKAMSNFNKSIKLKKTFDNLICAAQLAYFMQWPNYEEYLDEAESINPKRFDRYMKEYWEWEIC